MSRIVTVTALIFLCLVSLIFGIDFECNRLLTLREVTFVLVFGLDVWFKQCGAFASKASALAFLASFSSGKVATRLTH